MEKQLFDWDGWDIQDTQAFTYYNVVLKVDIGKYKIGDKFSSATIDYGEGTLQLYNSDTDYTEYKLSFAEITE